MAGRRRVAADWFNLVGLVADDGMDGWMGGWVDGWMDG